MPINVFKKKKVLVFAPHPDDETLGCGGFLLNLKKNGNELNCLTSIRDLATILKKETNFECK